MVHIYIYIHMEYVLICTIIDMYVYIYVYTYSHIYTIWHSVSAEFRTPYQSQASQINGLGRSFIAHDINEVPKNWICRNLWKHDQNLLIFSGGAAQFKSEPRPRQTRIYHIYSTCTAHLQPHFLHLLAIFLPSYLYLVRLIQEYSEYVYIYIYEYVNLTISHQDSRSLGSKRERTSLRATPNKLSNSMTIQGMLEASK